MLEFLFRDKRAGVTVMSTLLFIALTGVSSLAVEYGQGLLQKSQNQRVADLAAYSGAMIYKSTGSTGSATTAVNNMMALNGVPSGSATASLVSSPTGDGNQALEVSVTTTMPLFLARAVSANASLPVTAVAYAEIAANAPACLVALDHSGTGITLTGGTDISASACSVMSNSTVSVHCGDTITTTTLDYNSSSAPNDSCSGIQPPAGTAHVTINKTTVTDPVAGNSSVTAAMSRLSTVAAMTSPSAPSVSGGTAVDFGYSASATQTALTADGCSGAFSSNTWTVTCTGIGPFTFGKITLHGGISVNFSTGGSASATYNFSGMIDFSSGAALNFGPGTFNMAQGILTGGGSTMSFGAGTFNIGTLPAGKCSVNGESICHAGTSLTFGGPSTFVLSGGLYVPGGYTLTMGSGSTNSFNIGADSAGNSITGGGGSKITLADATGTGHLFQLAGNFNDGSGGGSCITVSAATNHDINGYMSLAGGVTLGAGTYTVEKYVGIGVGGGGDVSCNGSTVGVSALGVTFVIGGTATVTCADGSNQAFCVGAGYGHVTISAPTSGTMQGFAVLGPSSGTAGADFSNGASNTRISGVFYFPNGPIVMSGAASVGDTTSGDCMQMVGSEITLSGGSAVGTTCTTGGTGGSGSSGNKITLVQ
jgi:hypothetical protein